MEHRTPPGETIVLRPVIERPWFTVEVRISLVCETVSHQALNQQYEEITTNNQIQSLKSKLKGTEQLKSQTDFKAAAADVTCRNVLMTP